MRLADKWIFMLPLADAASDFWICIFRNRRKVPLAWGGLNVGSGAIARIRVL
jgi:hypothetical protein